MRLLVMLIALTLCTAALFIGCDPEIEIPIRQAVIPSNSPLDKARAAMKKVNERRTEVYQKAEESGDFSTILTASEGIFKEELGFRKGFWIDLVEIYRKENRENTALLEGLENLQDAFADKLEKGTLGMFYFEYISFFDEIITEYLRLSIEFPEKNEKEHLKLFRQSMRSGKIVIIFP